MKIELTCLVCLQQGKKMISVFEKPDEVAAFLDDEVVPKDLADIINECVDYKFQQMKGLPQQICYDCKESALIAFKFKRKCEEAYKQLIKILNLDAPLKNFQKYATTQTENTSQYLCDYCNEKYANAKDLMMHQQESHPNNALKCYFCKKSYSRPIHLQSHMTTFHAEIDFQSSSQCNICNRQFANTEQLRRHSASKHKITEIVQNYCKPEQQHQMDELVSLPDIEEVDLKILTENSFMPDNSNEQDEDLLVYIKQFDGMTDDEDNEPLSTLQQAEQSSNALEKIKLEHELEMPNIKSTEATNSCQLVNAGISETDEHTKTVSNKQNKIIPETKVSRKKKSNSVHCDMCEETFKHASQLQRHMNSKHQEKMHKCNICEKKFTTSTYLQRHVIMHAKKRYSCKECSESFLTKDELRDHVKSEGHDKHLLCSECGLRCRTSNILMVHLRRHKGEKPFKCKFCSKGFPRSDDLKLHEKYHTGEKSHFCGTCGKGFQRKYNLKIHLRVHTGEKPYKCPHCPQAFAQGNDLKAHIRRHTGERFRCELCDAAFLQGYQIRQHKLSEHGIRDEPPTQRVAKFTSIESQKHQILQNMNKESYSSTSHVEADTETF